MKRSFWLLLLLACGLLYAVEEVVPLRDYQANPRKYLGKSTIIENVEMRTVCEGTSPKDGRGSCRADVFADNIYITIYFRRKNLEKLCRQLQNRQVDITVRASNYKGPNGKRAYIFELMKIKEHVEGGNDVQPQEAKDDEDEEEKEEKPAKTCKKKKQAKGIENWK